MRKENQVQLVVRAGILLVIEILGKKVVGIAPFCWNVISSCGLHYTNYNEFRVP